MLLWQCRNRAQYIDLTKQNDYNKGGMTMVKPEKVYSSQNYVPEIVENLGKESKLAQAITETINGSFCECEFCKAMSQEHDFLQYEFTMLCLSWLKKCKELYGGDSGSGYMHAITKECLEDLRRILL
jgi:hypothetical protein